MNSPTLVGTRSALRNCCSFSPLTLPLQCWCYVLLPKAPSCLHGMFAWDGRLDCEVVQRLRYCWQMRDLRLSGQPRQPSSLNSRLFRTFTVIRSRYGVKLPGPQQPRKPLLVLSPWGQSRGTKYGSIAILYLLSTLTTR